MRARADVAPCGTKPPKDAPKSAFRVTLDTAFEAVIRACKDTPRPGQEGTWITRDMEEAYCRLHRLGYAHSVEVWSGNSWWGALRRRARASVCGGEHVLSCL